jgi:bifunctional DNA-binding transcriptional regulator/antitoxin component of YhaV-PrlF toxin-antitoxin module
MSYLRGMNDRRQITLPPSVLREVGVGEGAYFTIHAEAGRIVLQPREISEKTLGKEDWDLLDQLVKRQAKTGQSTRYKSAKDARRHLDRFR